MEEKKPDARVCVACLHRRLFCFFSLFLTRESRPVGFFFPPLLLLPVRRYPGGALARTLDLHPSPSAVRIYRSGPTHTRRVRRSTRRAFRSCCAPARPPLPDRTAEPETEKRKKTNKQEGNFWGKKLPSDRAAEARKGVEEGGQSTSPSIEKKHLYYYFFLLQLSTP